MFRSHTRRLRMVHEMEDKITLPQVFYYPTEVGGRLVYGKGGILKEVTLLDDDLDTALLFKDAGMIHTYAIREREGVSMYLVKSMDCDNSNNVFPKSKLVLIRDFDFTKGQAITIAALHEISLTKGEYGMQKKIAA